MSEVAPNEENMFNNFRAKVKSTAVKFAELSFIKKLTWIVIGFGTLVSFSILLLIALIVTGRIGAIPDSRTLGALQRPAASEVYSADSVLMGRFFLVERSDIPFAHIPQHLVDALLATEDIRYYTHRGVDYQSLVRVFVKSILLQDNSSGGGSTLTQQLVKNLFPRKQYWVLTMSINKLREMIIARRLEKLYSKNELLELYFNTIPFGENTFGIESAAQRFYSIPARELSVDQSAVLIGMLKATQYYNPRLFPERSLERRNIVLSQMKKYRLLQTSQADSLMRIPLRLAYYKATAHTGMASYLREQVRLDLIRWCRDHTDSSGEPLDLYTSGLKIYTTINSKLQQQAESAMAAQMSLLQDRFLTHWAKAEPWHSNAAILNEAIAKSTHYKQLARAGIGHEEAIKLLQQPVAMTIFTWQGEKEIVMSPYDSIRHYLRFLNAGVMAMEPQTGAIRVWVGGIDHRYFPFDHVKETTKRQVGSAIKPIVFAAALEAGIRPCSYTSAEKITYTDLEDWTPLNSEENYDLKYSMEGALTFSVNTAAVHMLERVGIDKTITLARRMGITSNMEPVPALALGAASISVTEMANAYSTIANGGTSVTPHYLTAIAGPDGKILERFTVPRKQRVLSKRNAQMLVQMLKRVVNEGTGVSMRSKFNVWNDMAGKTGTTQSNADGWFIAMTPNLVVASWVGADDPRIHFRSTSLGQGASTALPIVATFFKNIGSDKSLERLSGARFPELPVDQQRALSCALFKTDQTALERIFGKRKTDTSRVFGARKSKTRKGFLKRLLGL